MPPRGVKKPSAKKSSPSKRASKIATRTVSRQRGKTVEAKTAPRRDIASKTSRKTASSSQSGGVRSRSSSIRGRTGSTSGRSSSSPSSVR